MNNKNTSIQMIADYEGDISNLLNTNVLGEVPILTTRNLVVFPGVVSPILVGREASVKLLSISTSIQIPSLASSVNAIPMLILLYSKTSILREYMPKW